RVRKLELSLCDCRAQLFRCRTRGFGLCLAHRDLLGRCVSFGKATERLIDTSLRTADLRLRLLRRLRCRSLCRAHLVHVCLCCQNSLSRRLELCVSCIAAATAWSNCCFETSSLA